jgi:hypothetical protein
VYACEDFDMQSRFTGRDLRVRRDFSKNFVRKKGKKYK